MSKDREPREGSSTVGFENSLWGVWSPPWWPRFYRLGMSLMIGTMEGMAVSQVINYLPAGNFKIAIVMATGAAIGGWAGIEVIKMSLDASSKTSSNNTSELTSAN